jgi:hypothetical protein
MAKKYVAKVLYHVAWGDAKYWFIGTYVFKCGWKYFWR